MKKRFVLPVILLSAIFISTRTGTPEIPSVTIGKQTWMAMNFAKDTLGGVYYKRDSANKNLGRLYSYDAAKNGAPVGWHIPTLNEWIALLDAEGKMGHAAPNLVTGGVSTMNLSYGGKMSKDSDGKTVFEKKDASGFYWTATPEGDSKAYAIRLDTGRVDVGIDAFKRTQYFSVRYVKNIH